MIGEPNRPASVRVKQGNNEKTGDMPKYVSRVAFASSATRRPFRKGPCTHALRGRDDVNELMTLVNQLRGFPSHPSQDVYGLDAKLELNTFEIQWANEDDDPTAGDVSEIADETKTTFKEVVQSVEALGRTFAKKDAAI